MSDIPSRTQAEIDAATIGTVTPRMVLNSTTGEYMIEESDGGTGSQYGSIAIGQPKQMISVEAGYITKATLPKLAYLDRASDHYRDLHGPLAHQIRLNDREFSPNVVITALVNEGATDSLTYVQLNGPTRIKQVGHGLPISATLFIGSDGELTTTDPGEFRTVKVGQVLDANTLMLRPAEITEKNVDTGYTFDDVTVWERIPQSSILSAAVTGGTTEIWRADVVNVSSPSSAEIIQALFDRDDTDDVISSAASSGITFTLAKQSFVSDMELQLGKLQRWTADGTPQRATLDVLVYTAAGDGAPAETLKIWDRADGPIPVDQGLCHTVRINQLCEKIVVQWATSGSTLAAQGSIQHVALWGRPRREEFKLVPAMPKIKYERWAINRTQKPVIFAGLVDTYQPDRTGMTRSAREMGDADNFGSYSGWNDQPPGTVSSYLITDNRAIRDLVHTDLSGETWDRDNQPMLICDIEDANWLYLYTDSGATVTAKNGRWSAHFKMLRRIVPQSLLGVYNKATATVAMLAYYWAGQSNGQRFLEQEKLKQENADFLYTVPDFMGISLYHDGQATYNFANWKRVVDWAVQECHRRGRLCIPHFSGWDYTEDRIVDNLQDHIEYIMDHADGIMFWDSSLAGSWTETDRQDYAAAIRAALDKTSLPPASAVGIAGDVEPWVGGLSRFQTAASGSYTFFRGGKHDQALTVEVVAGAEIVAGTGKIDFGAAGPASPFAPGSGGTMVLRFDATSGEWKRVLHQ